MGGHRGLAGPPVTRAVTLAGYAVLLATAVAIEAAACRDRGPARFAAVIGALTAHPGTRLLLLAAWLWLGWHLFARVAG
jgi:phosphotransferase system  glucose/maltose/N-acetylglucosamine-specific IIC component